MAEIDMIPRSYHAAMQLQRRLGGFALCAAALLLTALLTSGLLRWRIATQAPLINQLRSNTAQTARLRAQLIVLSARKSVLSQQTAALRTLRGGGEVTRVADAIEASLNTGVWFKELHFAREASLLPAGQPAATQTGYLMVLPAGAGANASDTWRLSNNLEINGAATDHAALTDFLRSLSNQPAIADVHFVNSVGHVGDGSAQIDFNVIAATRPRREGSP